MFHAGANIFILINIFKFLGKINFLDLILTQKSKYPGSHFELEILSHNLLIIYSYNLNIQQVKPLSALQHVAIYFLQNHDLKKNLVK